MEPLRDYQVKTVKHIQENKCSIIANAAGLGKTRCVIESFKETDRVLYVCPAHLLPNVDKEITLWRPKFKKRIYAASYTFFSRLKGDVKIPNCNVIVLDECTYMKNPDAKTTMVLLYKIFPMAERFVFMSASPIQKCAVDLFPIISTAYPDKWKDPTEFGSHFANTHYDPYSGRITYVGVNTENVEELRELVRPIMIKFLKSDVAKELPPLLEQTVYLEPDKEPDYDWEELDIDKPTKEMKSEYALLGMQKIPHILDAIENSDDEPTLLFCHHRPVNEAYVQALSKMGKRVGAIIGGTSGAEKQAVVDLYQEGKLDYLVISMEAGGIGLNAPRTTREIYAELPMTYVTYYQTMNRGHRLNSKNAITIYKYCLKGTMDEALIAMINRKKGDSDSVIGKIDNITEQERPNAKGKKTKNSNTGTTDVHTNTEAITDSHTGTVGNVRRKRSSKTDAKECSTGQSTRPSTDNGGSGKGASDRDNSDNSTECRSAGEGRRYSFSADDLELSLIGQDDLGLSLTQGRTEERVKEASGKTETRSNGRSSGGARLPANSQGGEDFLTAIGLAGNPNSIATEPRDGRHTVPAVSSSVSTNTGTDWFSSNFG